MARRRSRAAAVLVRLRPVRGRPASRDRHRRRGRWGRRRPCGRNRLVRGLRPRRRTCGDDPDDRRPCGDAPAARLRRGGPRRRRRGGRPGGSGRRERGRGHDRATRPSRRSGGCGPGRVSRSTRLPAAIHAARHPAGARTGAGTGSCTSSGAFVDPDRDARADRGARHDPGARAALGGVLCARSSRGGHPDRAGSGCRRSGCGVPAHVRPDHCRCVTTGACPRADGAESEVAPRCRRARRAADRRRGSRDGRAAAAGQGAATPTAPGPAEPGLGCRSAECREGGASARSSPDERPGVRAATRCGRGNAAAPVRRRPVGRSAAVGCDVTGTDFGCSLRGRASGRAHGRLPGGSCGPRRRPRAAAAAPGSRRGGGRRRSYHGRP